MIGIRSRLWGLCLIVLLLTPISHAHRPSAQEAIQSVSESILAHIQSHRAQYQSNPEAYRHYLLETLGPVLDTPTMALWVAGRRAWQTASDAERLRFQELFRDQMIRSYGGSLLSYATSTIVFPPMRAPQEESQRVEVRAQVRKEGQEPVALSFRLIWTEDRWKIYDISIEGVSLLKGFQSQFHDTAQQGLAALIQRLGAVQKGRVA
jgi:phospholipid transport system substrate-binding protein